MPSKSIGSTSPGYVEQPIYSDKSVTDSTPSVSSGINRSISISAKISVEMVETTFRQSNLVQKMKLLNARHREIFKLKSSEVRQNSMIELRNEYQEQLDYCLALELQLMELKCEACENSQLVLMTDYLIKNINHSNSAKQHAPLPVNIEHFVPLHYPRGSESQSDQISESQPDQTGEQQDFCGKLSAREKYLNDILKNSQDFYSVSGRSKCSDNDTGLDMHECSADDYQSTCLEDINQLPEDGLLNIMERFWKGNDAVPELAGCSRDK